MGEIYVKRYLEIPFYLAVDFSSFPYLKKNKKTCDSLTLNEATMIRHRMSDPRLLGCSNGVRMGNGAIVSMLLIFLVDKYIAANLIMVGGHCSNVFNLY